MGACFGGTCGRVQHLRLRSRPPVHSLTTLAPHLTKQLYNFKKKTMQIKTLIAAHRVIYDFSSEEIPIYIMVYFCIGASSNSSENQ